MTEEKMERDRRESRVGGGTISREEGMSRERKERRGSAETL
jgi:hypothetical protein